MKDFAFLLSYLFIFHTKFTSKISYIKKKCINKNGTHFHLGFMFSKLIPLKMKYIIETEICIAHKNISCARCWMLNYLEKFTPLHFSHEVALLELMDLFWNQGRLSLFPNAEEWKYSILSLCCAWSRSIQFFSSCFGNTDMKTNVCLAQQEIVKCFTNTRWDFNNVCKT